MLMSAGRPADDEITDTVETYSDVLFRFCFSILCNYADAEDAVSDTMIRYIKKAPIFHEEEHKKAWLLKTASNICKDKHRFRLRHTYINLDDIHDYYKEESDKEILLCLLNLPDKYKYVIHLFYIEGYKTDEIAEILSISPAAVRKRLQYGRKLLKLSYEGDE